MNKKEKKYVESLKEVIKADAEVIKSAKKYITTQEELINILKEEIYVLEYSLNNRIWNRHETSREMSYDDF